MGDVNVTSNLFYDLVSIQYHALKGQEVYGRYIKDAQGQQDANGRCPRGDTGRGERVRQRVLPVG